MLELVIAAAVFFVISWIYRSKPAWLYKKYIAISIDTHVASNEVYAIKWGGRAKWYDHVINRYADPFVRARCDVPKIESGWCIARPDEADEIDTIIQRRQEDEEVINGLTKMVDTSQP